MPTGLERPFSKISDGSNNYSVKDSTARNDIATLNTRITNLEIDDLANINITSPTNGQALIYDATSEEWKNGAGGGGNVNEWVGTTSEFEEAIEQGEIADDTNILITNDYAGGGGGAQTLGELADTNIVSPIDGQTLVYDDASDMWKNGMIKSGMLPKLYIHSEAGESQVKATSPSGIVIIATQVVGSTTVWECDVPEFGVYTIDAIKDGDDHQTTITVDTVKVYHIDDYHYSYTLSVYAPFGSTVRVSATGETYTDIGEGDNPVIFGLHQPSTEYTVQVTVDGISETNTIESAATTGEDGDITFTFGTIVLTYVDDFKGVNITCTKSETEITKKAPTSNNVMYFYPNDIGTWVISGEVQSGGIFSVTATVESLGTPVYVELLTTPEGATVLPTDDIQTWLACAGIKDKSYTTLSEVLADTETYETLLADSNACQYMKRSTGWAGMTNLVPQMTGYTTPSGEVIYVGPGTGTSGNYPVWKAFDRNSSTDGDIAYNIGNSAGYHFTSPTVVNKIAMASTDSSTTTAFVFEGSNDNNTYTELLEFVGSNRTIKYYEFENETAYSYYRVRITNKTENWGDFGFQDLQFYKAGITTSQDAMARLGKFDYASNLLLSDSTWAEAIANSDYWNMVMENLVPKMTSDTAPSGECSLSSQYSTYAAYLAYDRDDSTASSTNSTQGVEHWSQYKSANPICAKRARLKFVTSNRTIVSCIIKGSNDGTNWTDIYSLTSSEIAELATGAYVNFPTNTTSYERHAVFATLNSAGVGISMYYIEFYGRASEEVLVPLVPTMTSNTTPSGEVIYSSVYSTSGFEAYKAFDNNTSTRWNGDNNLSTAYIGYKFTRPVCVNKVTFHPYYSNGGAYAKDYIVQGSNDGFVNDVHELYSGTHPNSDTTSSVTFNNNNEYLYYRLYLSTTYRDGYSLWDVQFYQRTVQTNIIHSAANDTIYMMEDGSQMPLCTTNSNGDGVLDFSQLPAGPVTLYSSVAKSPEDLTADYSKTITITKTQYGGTTEAYLMPDTIKTLYWWGREDNLEDISLANGWSYGSVGNHSFGVPTHNTYNLYMGAVSNQVSGVGSINKIKDASYIKMIGDGVALAMSRYSVLYNNKIKSIDSIEYVAQTSQALAVTTLTNTQTDFYIGLYANDGNGTHVWALWCE